MADFKSYNENELNRMRQDALRRMQEMQRRAHAGPASGEQPPAGQPPRQSAGDLRSLLGGMIKPPAERRGGGGLNIAGIAVDEEKAMIAMLIYILYKQGADVKLLLALGYLLL